MTLKERVEHIKQLQAFEAPWEIRRTGIKPQLFGTDLFLTDGDGDAVTVDEARTIVAWLAEQLGGSVHWASDKKPKGAK